jgi:hypothetical protein
MADMRGMAHCEYDFGFGTVTLSPMFKSLCRVDDLM